MLELGTAERLVLQAGTVSGATSILHTRAVLPVAISACSSAGTDVAQANADRVLLQAQDDVLVEEDARVHAVPRLREGRALNR
jgi:hypothetical protein